MGIICVMIWLCNHFQRKPSEEGQCLNLVIAFTCYLSIPTLRNMLPVACQNVGKSKKSWHIKYSLDCLCRVMFSKALCSLTGRPGHPQPESLCVSSPTGLDTRVDSLPISFWDNIEHHVMAVNHSESIRFSWILQSRQCWPFCIA